MIDSITDCAVNKIILSTVVMVDNVFSSNNAVVVNFVLDQEARVKESIGIWRVKQLK